MISPFWLFLFLGVGLLALELVVFQFTTFWLFFIGLGSLVAAAFAYFSVGSGYIVTTGVFVVASIIITAVLYAPIRRWQRQPTGIAGNNAISQRVKVTGPITPTHGGTVVWSGSEWQAELVQGSSQELAEGDWARVVDVQGIRLIVEVAA
jgi:membrane protein implicated in regulation of membrane protease activity